MSFTTLRFACQGKNCPIKYKREVAWTHYKCEGVLDIDDSADLRCSSCNITSNVFRWGFDCGSHSASDRSQLPSIDSLSSVIAMAIEMTDAMGTAWYKKLLQSLINTSTY